MFLSRLVLTATIFILFYYATLVFSPPILFYCATVVFSPLSLFSEAEVTPELGLGLSLTANHGTISVRRSDGTIEDTGRINGDDSYLDLMKRLSLKSSQHLRFVLLAYLTYLNLHFFTVLPTTLWKNYGKAIPDTSGEEYEKALVYLLRQMLRYYLI